LKKLAILGFCLILIAVVQPTFADEIQNIVISKTTTQIHKNALGNISVSKVYLKGHGIIYIILPDLEKGNKANLIDFQIVRKFPIVTASYLYQFPKQSFLSGKEEIVLVFNHINQVVVSLTNEVLLKYQNGEIPFDKLYDSLTTVSLDLEEVEKSIFIRKQAANFLVGEGKKKMSEYDPNERTWLGGYLKDKPEYLNRAVPYFDRALRIYPENKEAPYYKEEISRLLLARSLFNEAKTIYDQFKSEINSEDLNKKDKAIFSLYQAYDTLKKATKLNPEHKRVNELFEKLGLLLETEPRPKRVEELKTEKVAKEDVKKVEEEETTKFIVDSSIFDIDEILGKTISEIKNKFGRPSSNFQPTQAQLKLDPTFASTATWRKNGIAIQVDYFDNKPVKHIFIENNGIKYSQNKLMKMCNLALNSSKYTIVPVKAVKGSGITGLHIRTVEIGKPSTRPSSTIDLKASVRFTGTQFVITNNNSFDWTNVKLEVNSGLLRGGFVLKTKRICAGETYTVRAMQFAKGDGNRFNPLTNKPLNFSIWCDTPEGKGFWYGSWR